MLFWNVLGTKRYDKTVASRSARRRVFLVCFRGGCFKCQLTSFSDQTAYYILPFAGAPRRCEAVTPHGKLYFVVKGGVSEACAGKREHYSITGRRLILVFTAFCVLPNPLLSPHLPFLSHSLFPFSFFQHGFTFFFFGQRER